MKEAKIVVKEMRNCTTGLKIIILIIFLIEGEQHQDLVVKISVIFKRILINQYRKLRLHSLT